MRMGEERRGGDKLSKDNCSKYEEELGCKVHLCFTFTCLKTTDDRHWLFELLHQGANRSQVDFEKSGGL